MLLAAGGYAFKLKKIDVCFGSRAAAKGAVTMATSVIMTSRETNDEVNH